MSVHPKWLVRVKSNDGEIVVTERHDSDSEGQLERDQHPETTREQFLALFPVGKILEMYKTEIKR